jgi:hypothetical protein
MDDKLVPLYPEVHEKRSGTQGGFQLYSIQLYVWTARSERTLSLSKGKSKETGGGSGRFDFALWQLRSAR